MFGGHFYHSTIRRFVSVFGTLFNNITVLRKDNNGNVLSTVKVPLAYGPKEKFLVRIDEEKDFGTAGVAIKLPRMSFEILNITYDTQSKLNKNNKILVDGKTYYTFSPYNISLNLAIMAKNQDDALQIIEQIIPYFQPDYTITVKEGISDSVKTDIPITLSSIDMQEDYEGDFMNRRAIIYTLAFDAKVRFYGPDKATKQIKKVTVNTRENKVSGSEQFIAKVDPFTAKQDEDYTIIEEIRYLDDPNRVDVTLKPYGDGGNGLLYQLTEVVTGQISGATGVVQDFNNGVLVVAMGLDDRTFQQGEFIVGATSGAQWLVERAVSVKGY